MKKTLQQGLLAALIISITACGGGGGGSKNSSSAASSVEEASSSTASSTATSMSSSSSSSVVSVSTTYTVSVSAPVINEVASLGNLLIPSAMAVDAPSLSSENFAVVIVNLAGEVLETIEVDANDITQNEDGTYSINVPGNPRLDCLIVTNLNGPVVLPVASNINEVANLLFAPTTDENVDIDIGSTAGFLNFIEELGGSGLFGDAGIDPTNTTQIALVESIINNVQEVINNQVVIGYNSIADAIAAIQEAVVEIVEQETLNVTNPVSNETTLATALDGGGIYWFEAYEKEYIEYGHITADAPESQYIFDGSSFVLDEGTDGDRDLRLANGEWVQTTDRIAVDSINEDGSLNLKDSDTSDDSYHVESYFTYNLANRNIHDYLYATFDTRALADYVSTTATFPEGAVGFRLNITSLSDNYRIWYNAGAEDGTCKWDSNKNANDFGGNCETLGSYFWQADQQSGYYDYDQATATLAGILSTDVATNVTGFRMVSVNWPGDNQSINVQLVNNEAKTARYYLMTWGNNGNQLGSVIGEGTWSYISLPGMTGDAAQAIRIDIPEAVKTYGDFDSDQESFIMVAHNGFVRLGNIEEAGTLVETGVTVLNSEAGEAILGAVLTPISANSICFNNPDSYATPYIYYWGATDGVIADAGWPGVAMESKGDYYCHDFTEALNGNEMPASMNVIFNNNGNPQTADLVYTNGDACYQSGQWTTLEACGFKAVVDQSHELAGTWQLGDDYVVFGEDGTITHIKTATDDSNCQVGVASGVYMWDQLNSSLDVELSVDTTGATEGSTCSIGGTSTMTLDETGLHVNSDGDDLTLTKVVATLDAPLAGAWSVDGSDVFVFTASNNFAHGKIINEDVNCKVGVASGSYSWDSNTSVFLTNIVADSTAVAVDDSCSIAAESTAELSGNSLLFTVDLETFNMTKIGE